jgi:tetratricopeptide (TPR) repeat protein
VQRWERDEGLPVHRHQHKERGTVYAYTAEIDRWSEQRRLQREPEPPEPPEPPPTGFWKRVARRAPVLVTLVLILALATVASLRPIARYYNNRGVQLQQMGDLEGAIQDYKKAIAVRSSYAEAHYNLGDSYEDLQDFDKARDEYQRAVESDPRFYEAYNNLARLYIKQRKDYGAALGLLDRALSLKPSEPEVNYSLYKNYGWASLEIGARGQAEHYLKNAIALEPERGAAHCLMAELLDGQMPGDKALAEWESCAAYGSQVEVEPEWKLKAQERLMHEATR